MAAAALFDAYVMVDWSAAAVPRLGRDSIWIHELRRRGDALSETLSINLPTRAEARERLRDLLAGHLSAGLATLVGFDFPFGYPHGFAARLGLGGPAWRGVWELLAARIRDEADNRNNRFAVAAKLNREISGGAAPFWGCPAAAAGEFLQPTHHRSHGALDLAEKRLAEARIKGPQPVWKLVGAGAVGSQALTGIPVVHWLRRHPSLAEACAVWPFETGLAVPHPPPRPRIILAEVYPSLVRPVLRDGEVKDAAQLRTIARHFATLDAAGRLAAQFAGPPDLSAEDRARIEAEEGWILGVPREEPPAATRQAPPPRYAYLRDPDAIYRQSFARIRDEVDLSRFPAQLHALVLRLVHAAGEPALAGDLVWSEGAAASGRAALAAGAPVLVDATMVRAGIIERRLAQKNRVLCFLGDRRVPGLAQKFGTTRAAAAVELWRPRLAGAVVAIGNAPTALFHLLEMVASGAPRPALVLGFPVGFVGAAEAKAALAENPFGLAFIALRGRRGGSALAAAAVNALAGDAP
ncbi:MAG TPA: precorrin-8X methylmutase [Stellaceae bacterium]|nr:precorrin-8X methylmutase [Stellaceae bacterium]